MRQKKAQIWILSPQQDQVLLLQTGEERAYHWQPVTGGVETTETFEEGALRELKEETGWSVRLISLGEPFHFEGRWGPATEKVFYGILPQIQSPQLDPSEHVDYRWVSFSQARDLLHYESHREYLKKLESQLK